VVIGETDTPLPKSMSDLQNVAGVIIIRKFKLPAMMKGRMENNVMCSQ
jgi:hypothetical protein